jgi:hypothetical protein
MSSTWAQDHDPAEPDKTTEHKTEHDSQGQGTALVETLKGGGKGQAKIAGTGNGKKHRKMLRLWVT